MQVSRIAVPALLMSLVGIVPQNADATTYYSANAISGAQYPYSDTTDWAHADGRVYNNKPYSNFGRRNWAVPVTLSNSNVTWYFKAYYGSGGTNSCALAVSNYPSGARYGTAGNGLCYATGDYYLGSGLFVPSGGTAYVDYTVSDGGGYVGRTLWYR